MVHDIPLDKASLISLWVESVLYGAYTVLFFLCVHVLFANRKEGAVNKPLLMTAVVMFVLSTAHIVVGLTRAIAAFVNESGEPESALKYYAQIWLPLSIFKQALYATNNVVADGLVIFRCYVVWGCQRKVVAIPIIMLIATTVCAYLAVYNFSQIVPGQNVFASNIAEWGTALFSLSLATNSIVTVLIATRIWWIARQSNALLGSGHSRKYDNAVAIIVESGAIYSASLVILLVLYRLQAMSQYIVYDALAQIMGIVPTLIIVRVGLGISSQGMSQPSTAVGTIHTAGSRNKVVPMQVRKVVRVDRDGEESVSRSKIVDDVYSRAV